MPRGNPNAGKLANFIAKIWDRKEQEYKPIYTAPDATDDVYGDVLLSDATDSNLDAAKGVTAATPKAVKSVQDNAETKLSKTSVEPQTVAGGVTWKEEQTFEKNVTGTTFTGDLKGNADTTTKLQKPVTITTKSGEFVSPNSTSTSFNDGENITLTLGQIEASSIAGGVIDISHIPQAAIERLVNYQGKTLAEVVGEWDSATDKPYQIGDSILVTEGEGDSTHNTMFVAVGPDLSVAGGYVEYAAGTASEALHAEKADMLTVEDTGSNAQFTYFQNGVPVAREDGLGSDIKPIYIDADGAFAEAAHTVEIDVPDNAIFDDHIYIGFSDELPEDNENEHLIYEQGLVPLPTEEQKEDGNLYLNSQGEWVKVKAGVSGVKGDREEDYRLGDVNITHDNIGAVGLVLNDDDSQSMTGFSDMPDAAIITTIGGFLPGDETTNIGSATAKFNAVYANTFYGDLEGNADTATSATTASQVDKTLTFKGGATGSVNLNTAGNQDVTLTVPSQIAVQTDQPTDANVKLWIKV